jgi:hypothetical protein
MRWSEVQGALRLNRRLAHDEPAWCGWAVEDAGWRQKWVVQLGGAPACPVLILLGQVCSRESLQPAEALRYNATAMVGALAIEGAAYVLRQVLPTEALTPERLERALVEIEAEIRRLREQQLHDRTAGPAFAHVYSYFAD